MTDKKRRQRGSRTHGGGSHKKRRNAGNRGGRGRAGRDKHEKLLYPPRQKYGFSRPQKTDRAVETINLRRLDEDMALFVADDLAAETGDGYAVDVRDVVEDGHEVDEVKVLAAGQVHNAIEVTADAFSEEAREKLEAAGGDAVLSERGAEAEEPTTDDDAGDE